MAQVTATLRWRMAANGRNEGTPMCSQKKDESWLRPGHGRTTLSDRIFEHHRSDCTKSSKMSEPFTQNSAFEIRRNLVNHRKPSSFLPFIRLVHSCQPAARIGQQYPADAVIHESDMCHVIATETERKACE